MNARYLLSLSCAALLALTGCGSKHCSMNQEGGADSQISAVAKDFSNNTQDKVYFHFDKSDLTTDAKTIVATQAEYIKQHDNLNVTIEGHADERGTADYNMALGAKRAESVKKELINNGIKADKITTISYGKDRPLEQVNESNKNNAEKVHAKNRRAVTVVSH